MWHAAAGWAWSLAQPDLPAEQLAAQGGDLGDGEADVGVVGGGQFALQRFDVEVVVAQACRVRVVTLGGQQIESGAHVLDGHDGHRAIRTRRRGMRKAGRSQARASRCVALEAPLGEHLALAAVAVGRR